MLAARRTGLSALDSNKTLMKEHPSKDFLWNQPSNTSKIASRRASGLVVRRFISDSNQPRVSTVSRDGVDNPLGLAQRRQQGGECRGVGECGVVAEEREATSRMRVSEHFEEEPAEQA